MFTKKWRERLSGAQNKGQHKQIQLKHKNPGQEQWLTPVTSAFLEAEVGGSPESRVQDQPGQHGKTLSL